jgi:hypothetical protein
MLHVSSHLSKQIKHLIKSHASQTKQIGCELGRIKNEVWREIQALKNVMTTAEEHEDNESIAQQWHGQRKNGMFEESHHLALSSSTSFSSSIASAVSSMYDKSDAPIPAKISTKSIKSSIKLNERKMSKMMMMRKCCDDKFSIKIDDKKDNDNSMAEEDDCDEEQNNITDASMMSSNI